MHIAGGFVYASQDSNPPAEPGTWLVQQTNPGTYVTTKLNSVPIYNFAFDKTLSPLLVIISNAP